MLSTYLVAIFAILFSAASALTLIYTVKHLDPQPVVPSPERLSVAEQVAFADNVAV